MTIQIKATEQYFPVVLFIMLYKVVLTFESVDETLCSSIPPWYQRVEIKPVVFADGQENYWL